MRIHQAEILIKQPFYPTIGYSKFVMVNDLEGIRHFYVI